MLNPKLKRYSERIASLIEESKTIASLERPSSVGSYIQDKVSLGSWLVKTKSIVEITFGVNSPHFKEFERISSGHMEHAYEVNAVQGFLKGALDDLENGYFIGQEFIIAGELFDSVLNEAKQLNHEEHKDAAAVLSRVVLENSLKKIASRENINESQKASKINDDLKGKNVYAQPMWRQIQTWLDIGNAAAHGKFDEYTKDDVNKMIDGTLSFMSLNFIQ